MTNHKLKRVVPAYPRELRECDWPAGPVRAEGTVGRRRR